MELIHKRLIEKRKAAHMTVAELSRRSGINRSPVSEIESEVLTPNQAKSAG